MVYHIRKQTLQKYNIKKTPSQIIKEYYQSKGEELSDKAIQNIEKNYRQKERLDEIINTATWSLTRMLENSLK